MTQEDKTARIKMARNGTTFLTSDEKGYTV